MSDQQITGIFHLLLIKIIFFFLEIFKKITFYKKIKKLFGSKIN